MNGLTLLSFRLFAAAALFGFVLWQFRRHGLDVGPSLSSFAAWPIGGLCGFGLIAAVASALNQARLSRSDAVAFVLNGFGILAVVLFR